MEIMGDGILAIFNDRVEGGPTTAYRNAFAAESQEENLILMTRKRLWRLVPPNKSATMGYTGLWLGPFSSNLYLALHSNDR
jgi:hypothetical protein